MSSEPLIEFKNVTKRFSDKIVLEGIDLEIYPEEVTTLIGKSGVGKSVTLKLIIGLLKPDRGEIFYQGTSMTKMSRRELKEMKNQVNFMFQNNALFDSMDIFDNIALPLKEKTSLKSSKIKERVEEKMSDLDISGIESKFPSQLSGGMQKRVALARALITEPKIVLFDEPTTGLDPLRKNSVLNMITHNQKNFGFTAVIVSHDIPDVFFVSNRVAIIDQGRILFQGVPMDLEQSEDQNVHDFIHSQEIMKNEIIGLRTRIDLERAYKSSIKSSFLDDSFLVLLLTLENCEQIMERVGFLVSQKVISTLTEMLYKYIQVEGTIFARYTQNRILCILPKTTKETALSFCHKISTELQEKSFVQRSKYPRSCVNFEITAGLAQGSQNMELPDLVEEAQKEQMVLASLLCGEDK
ncbi:MAG TPA: ATP-binding cassette domain-containing protein [Desulfohalobiaceae bacterium]|nr:ATP-binding cassette domain-containing protein [Desulfohalobiaceae bacterium]